VDPNSTETPPGYETSTSEVREFLKGDNHDVAFEIYRRIQDELNDDDSPSGDLQRSRVLRRRRYLEDNYTTGTTSDKSSGGG
jgi:hypothetical protein